MPTTARCRVWCRRRAARSGRPTARNATTARIEEAHKLGLKVLPWTVNDPAEMARLIDLGVDGLITDYPDRLRKVMAQRGMALPLTQVERRYFAASPTTSAPAGTSKRKRSARVCGLRSIDVNASDVS